MGKVKNGYWKNEENIINYAKGLKEGNNTLPNTTQLMVMGEGSFCNAVYKYFPGGFNGLKEHFAISPLEKPYGFWNKETILRELEEISHTNNGFALNYCKMRENNHTDLLSAIERKFGSYQRFCLQNGFLFKKANKPFGYWNKTENVIKELNEVINIMNMGYFPTYSTLMNLKKYSLCKAIVNNGGIRPLKKEMGFADKGPIAKDGKLLDSQQEVWVYDVLLDDEDIEFEYNTILNLDNKKIIPDFFIKNYLIEGRKILIEVLMADPNNVKNLKNKIQKEYVEHYSKKKELYLNHKDEYYLFEIIPCDFKIENFKIKMDYILTSIKKKGSDIVPPIGLTSTKFKRTNGYWCDFDNVKKEYEKLNLELNHFPKYSELPGYLKRAIQHHYGGHYKVAEMMGHSNDVKRKKNPRRPGYWSIKGNILKELLTICNNLGRFPNSNDLKSQMREDLLGAIYKNYDRYVLAEELGFPLEKKKRKSSNYWNRGSMLKELRPICLKLNGIPTENQLRNMGLCYLSHYERYITRDELANILNLQLIKFRMPNGYWKNWDNVKIELDDIYNKLSGRRPHQKDFKDLNKYNVLKGITKYNRSMIDVLNKFEKQSINLRNLY